jgi:hypothetical protein
MLNVVGDGIVDSAGSRSMLTDSIPGRVIFFVPTADEQHAEAQWPSIRQPSRS